jgi:hypothetical protein
MENRPAAPWGGGGLRWGPAGSGLAWADGMAEIEAPTLDWFRSVVGASEAIAPWLPPRAGRWELTGGLGDV